MRTTSIVPHFFPFPTAARAPCIESPPPRMPVGCTAAPPRDLTPIPRRSVHSTTQERTGALSAPSHGVVSGRCCFSPCARESGTGAPPLRGPRLAPAVVGSPCLGQTSCNGDAGWSPTRAGWGPSHTQTHIHPSKLIPTPPTPPGPRACYGLWATTVTKRWSIRQAKATKCRPATVSGNRS